MSAAAEVFDALWAEPDDVFGPVDMFLMEDAAGKVTRFTR